MSVSKRTRTTETRNEQRGVADWLQPYMQGMAPRAEALLNRGTQIYQGPLVAGFSPESEAGLQGLTGYAAGGMPGLNMGYGALANAMGGRDPGRLSMLRGAYGPGTQATELRGLLDTGPNPYLDAQFGRAADQVRNQVAAAMSRAGMSGTGAQQDLLQRGLGDLATSIYGGAYESDAARRASAASQLAGLEQADLARSLQAGGMLSDAARAQGALGLQAAGMIPGMYAAGRIPYEDMLRVGQARDFMGQAQIDAERQRFEQGQMMPWQDLARYQALINPLGQTFGRADTRSDQTQTESGSALQSILGAAMMASTLFGNPFGAAMGGAMGGLGGHATRMALGAAGSGLRNTRG